MASDYAMSTCELRVTERSSQEGYGNDADRVEFRFRDANNRLDLKCGRTSVPGTWLTVSHISGPALINTIQTCRSQRARVEGPDHVQQFAQLSALISPWYNDAIANEDGVVGTTTDQFPVERGNFHLRARSKLKVTPLTFVRQEALAHRSHDAGNELTARRGPPALMEEAAKQMTIPSKSPLPRSETRSKIFLDFARWGYHSSDVFDRMDVAVVGDADAHNR